MSETILQEIMDAAINLYKNWTPDRNSEEMVALLRAVDKMTMYLDGDFEAVWKIEQEENELLRERIEELTKKIEIAPAKQNKPPL